MRRVLVAIGLTLALVLMVLGGVSAAAADTVAGNRVIDRPNVDSWTNIYLVDKNHPSNAAGNVNRWEVWAKNTNQVQLVIYRYNNGWSVVGNSDVVTPNTGHNVFSLTNPIAVQAGDYVGLHFPGAGPVAFSVNGDLSLGEGNMTGSVLQTNQGGGQTDFAISSNRVYSVRASTGNGDNAGEDGVRAGHRRNLTIHLSGKEANVNTHAQGEAIFHLSKDGATLNYKLIVDNIENVTGAYINGADNNAVAQLYPSSGQPSPTSGQFHGILAQGTITASNLTGQLSGKGVVDLMSQLEAGNAYVIVDTSQNTSGEIRGQLKPKGHANPNNLNDDQDDGHGNGNGQNQDHGPGYQGDRGSSED